MMMSSSTIWIEENNVCRSNFLNNNEFIFSIASVDFSSLWESVQYWFFSSRQVKGSKHWHRTIDVETFLFLLTTGILEWIDRSTALNENSLKFEVPDKRVKNVLRSRNLRKTRENHRWVFFLRREIFLFNFAMFRNWSIEFAPKSHKNRLKDDNLPESNNSERQRWKKFDFDHEK